MEAAQTGVSLAIQTVLEPGILKGDLDATRPVSCPLCGSDTSRAVYARELLGVVWQLFACGECELRYTVPCPNEQQLAQLYSGDYHAELRAPGAAEAAFGPKFRRYSDWIQCYCPSGRALDIGCSTGLLVRMLCDRGFEAEGIELNAASAAWASRHYGVKVQNEPLREGLFEGGRFDLVIMADVLEHTVTPLTYLKMVRTFLRPGGFMFISFPDIRSLESRYWFMLSKLARRGWLWRNCHVPHHIWEFARSTATRMFREAGFQVEGFRRDQPRPEHDSSLLLRLLSTPPHLLRLRGISGRCGTQMEFLIRRID